MLLAAADDPVVNGRWMLHSRADGTLQKLSLKWFKADLTPKE